jgi:hypothetical protein
VVLIVQILNQISQISKIGVEILVSFLSLLLVVGVVVIVIRILLRWKVILDALILRDRIILLMLAVVLVCVSENLPS